MRPGRLGERLGARSPALRPRSPRVASRGDRLFAGRSPRRPPRHAGAAFSYSAGWGRIQLADGDVALISDGEMLGAQGAIVLLERWRIAMVVLANAGIDLLEIVPPMLDAVESGLGAAFLASVSAQAAGAPPSRRLARERGSRREPDGGFTREAASVAPVAEIELDPTNRPGPVS